MAIPIKSVPVLTGKVAIEFNKRAAHNAKYNRGKIDFSENIKICSQILRRANLPTS